MIETVVAIVDWFIVPVWCLIAYPLGVKMGREWQQSCARDAIDMTDEVMKEVGQMKHAATERHNG